MDNRTITCVARQTPEPAEVCDNGQDDDCNGIVDDGAECTQNFTATTDLVIGSDNPEDGEGDDAPAHHVCLDPFTIDRHEVTMRAFAVFLSSFDQSNIQIGRPPRPLNPTVVYGRYVMLVENGEHIPLMAVPNEVGPLSFDQLAYAWAPHDRNNDALPAVNVTWLGANRYCQWAGKHLPTEAEFFRVARGPTGTRAFPWGSEPPTCDRANIGRGGPDGGPCVGEPLPVDSLQAGATAEGVFHLYGNANEWMYDYLDTNASHTRNNYYESLPADGGAWCATYPHGPIGPATGAPISQPEDAGLYCVNCRFARGRHYRTVDLRIGIRRWLDADRGEPFVGFRCSQGGADRP
jgi:formylglycine-generating enzyme required for sulfatase activity